MTKPSTTFSKAAQLASSVAAAALLSGCAGMTIPLGKGDNIRINPNGRIDAKVGDYRGGLGGGRAADVAISTDNGVFRSRGENAPPSGVARNKRVEVPVVADVVNGFTNAGTLTTNWNWKPGLISGGDYELSGFTGKVFSYVPISKAQADLIKNCLESPLQNQMAECAVGSPPTQMRAGSNGEMIFDVNCPSYPEAKFIKVDNGQRIQAAVYNCKPVANTLRKYGS